jgi:hypothetical protein
LGANGGLEEREVLKMKRVAALLLAVCALGLFAAQAVAAEGSYGPWEPTYQGPITAPAGVVCPFEVTAEPLFQKMRIRYHFDETGSIDGYEVIGPLIARVTNTATAESIHRNLSSEGVVYLHPDGSYDAVVNGNFLIFFLGEDNPSHQLLLLVGRTVLHGASTGEKTLVSSTGHTENLCETLA